MDEYISKIRSGDLKLYALEKSLPADDAVSLRRTYIEEETGTDLSAVGTYTIPIERVVTRNIENMIGCVQIPLGVAGPLTVKGEYANGSFWLPLATTEGALVASINRGCSAITKAGGTEVRILRDGMTRAPIFAAKSVAHAAEVARWAEDNLLLLKVAAEETTNHGELIGLTTYTAGTSVFIRFEFDTKDAMGMNMATIASEAAAHLIEEETKAKLIAVSGNMCCDKKPSAINIIEGRGKTVSAGIFLSDELVSTVFKTNSATLAEVNTRKNITGSARAAFVWIQCPGSERYRRDVYRLRPGPGACCRGKQYDHNRGYGRRRSLCLGYASLAPGRNDRRRNEYCHPECMSFNAGRCRGSGKSGRQCKSVCRNRGIGCSRRRIVASWSAWSSASRQSPQGTWQRRKVK